MRNNNAFTLLEVLFAMGILSLLLFISIPLNLTTLEKQQIEQFFKTFESDVLYIQNSSITTDEIIYLRFLDDRYILRKANGNSMATRNYPKGLKIDSRTKPDIVFHETGTIINPRTIKVTTNNGTYHIVFPLGKGRCYIVKI
ncbi:competence protein ComGD [Virgibacillus halotolerans]|uniref:competence type IV pilus minor pilin ComGD n=1 Tax=Virgibacillus halotolerans TaxID=1071053 RepID=UPI00195FA16C|nr:competence type IV pilus minor pilin ComGD [Virgibacillus halotolerans]MBM7597973.1 competence protein ComGD [Virgibacillus halotolerans]